MLHTLLGEHRANWVVFMCLNWSGSQLELEIRGSFHTLERVQRTPASPRSMGDGGCPDELEDGRGPCNGRCSGRFCSSAGCAARRCHHLVLPGSSLCAICADHVGRRTG